MADRSNHFTRDKSHLTINSQTKDTMGPLNPVSVKAVFDLPEKDNITEIYNSENCETARIGLPENTEPSKVCILGCMCSFLTLKS